MASGRTYAGAWARRASVPTPVVPLKPSIDPEHLYPTDNVDLSGADPMWLQSDVAPAVPQDWTGDPFGTPIGGGGPIDRTPRSHDYGPGVSPGITQLESQALMSPWHQDDQGAVAARRWQPTTDRTDGDGPHVAIIADSDADGDSPSTLDYRYRTGVGMAGDGGLSRTGLRQKRWWNRFIDRHMWDVQYRPMYTVNARGSIERPAAPVPNQLTPGTPANGPFTATPDHFTVPQMRRSPVQWDQPFTVDATPSPGDSFGLGSWGL